MKRANHSSSVIAASSELSLEELLITMEVNEVLETIIVQLASSIAFGIHVVIATKNGKFQKEIFVTLDGESLAAAGAQLQSDLEAGHAVLALVPNIHIGCGKYHYPVSIARSFADHADAPRIFAEITKRFASQ